MTILTSLSSKLSKRELTLELIEGVVLDEDPPPLASALALSLRQGVETHPKLLVVRVLGFRVLAKTYMALPVVVTYRRTFVTFAGVALWADKDLNAALQEATTSLSQISLVIDSLKNDAEAKRTDYINKRMEDNRMKLAGITKNNHILSVERRNLGIINGGETDNLLAKRMKEAIDIVNGDSNFQDYEHASVMLLGSGIPVKPPPPHTILPKMEKILPFTTWAFIDRNQYMEEDQSVVGRRRLYYDRDGGETLICSDSEDEVIEDKEEKKRFFESEDSIIWSTIEQAGSSDIVYDLLSQRLSRKPCEIKERYEALKCSKPWVADFNINSFLDNDLEDAQDSFDKLFCRRCLIFDCKLHGCSQDLIYPAEMKRSTGKSLDVEMSDGVPCGAHCYLQFQNDLSVCPKLEPVHDVNPTNPDSPSPTKTKRARISVTSGSKETHELGSSSVKAKFLSTGNSLVYGRNNTKKKNLSMDDHSSRNITDFESWRSLEKSLIQKGVEIFGKNSCLIARNTMNELKTCAEVYHVLQYHENKLYSQGSNGINSQDDDRTKTNENRRRSNFFHRRGRFRRLRYTWKSARSRSARRQNSGKKAVIEHQYNPCECQTACSGDCPCLASGTCEKYCGCPKTCKNRFRGCHCAKSQYRSRQCPCFAARRECDSDLCQHCWISCGDGTLGSPGKKGNSFVCQNMKLLLKTHQRILLGKSKVSGWGAFLKNSAAKDEYLGEYTGELISHHEADKRGKIYDRIDSSYLFNLNDHYVVDAYRKGNKLKFANHSTDPNCYAKVMMLAGDHRVGIFAKKNISAGEELFYDYGYEPDQAPYWAKKAGHSGKKKEGIASSAKKTA
ncbi:histone-lysine N-methyltransferase CLF-like [Bidens hawaiensis]|uniref:histone-lysine N-methyltransferase CLF-like n=1 Tax=Bidens hawaiensis TaxID=980011 RepID=UPI00404AAF2F